MISVEEKIIYLRARLQQHALLTGMSPSQYSLNYQDFARSN